MSRNFFISLIILFLIPIASNAQSTAYGFRVGLNVSTILTSDLEAINGTDAESFATNSGFHVGGGVKFKFTDLFGIRAELLFSQKGTKYTFEGESFQVFLADNGNKILANGSKNLSLNITNAYLDIPIVAYGKVGNKLEFNGGVYVGFLLSSTAAGQLEFNGNSALLNNAIENLILNLDYNYSRDEGINTPDDNTAFMFNADNAIINLPERVGAFFDKDESSSGNPYGTLDAGVTGGISFFLNEGLYVSANAQYGLIDVTKEEFDFSQATNPDSNLNLTTRNDSDTNLSVQFSVGFSF